MLYLAFSVHPLTGSACHVQSFLLNQCHLAQPVQGRQGVSLGKASGSHPALPSTREAEHWGRSARCIVAGGELTDPWVRTPQATCRGCCLPEQQESKQCGSNVCWGRRAWGLLSVSPASHPAFSIQCTPPMCIKNITRRALP